MKNRLLSSVKYVDESEFKKARTGDNRKSVRIKLEDIPSFLHDGAFYKSLKEGQEDDGAVDVPSRCFCYTEEVCSPHDLEQFLRVMAFWGLSTLPECLIKFCCDNEVNCWSESIDETSSELTFAHDLRSIFELGLEEALPAAIKLGKSEVVEYLAKGEISTEKGTFAAAQCGRVDYLILLHHHGHPWDKAACAAAAEGGYLDCLQFLHEHGCEWDHHVYTNAAFRQRYCCIKYACVNGLAWNDIAVEAVARMDHIDTLKFVIEHGCPLRPGMTKWAAYEGNIECLEYLLDLNCPVVDAVHYACQPGRINCLQLLRDYGVSWDKGAAEAAAQYNQLECLQYLYENGCPWDTQVSTEAAKEGNADILQYCLKNGCPYEDDVFIFAAAGNRCALDCVRYIVEEQGMYMDENGEVFAVAFGNADIELMEYLLDNGCPYQNYSDTAPFFLILYLEIQRDDAEDDAECFLDFEVRLIECIQLAHKHGYNFTDDLLQFICENFPLCRGYLEMEGCLDSGVN